MRVFVKNMRGQALMPCSTRKARLLLKDGNDEYITMPGKSYKQIGISNIKLLYKGNGWQEIPQLKQGDFLP